MRRFCYIIASTGLSSMGKDYNTIRLITILLSLAGILLGIFLAKDYYKELTQKPWNEADLSFKALVGIGLQIMGVAFITLSPRVAEMFSGRL